MRPLIRAFASATILLGLAASHASAGLTIGLDDVNLVPGGTGTMDISITSTLPFTLSSFGLELQITPIGTPASVLQFTSAQPTAPFGSANYVFFGNSFDQSLPIPFWSIPGTNPMETAVGGDSTNTGFVSPTPTTNLLAVVQFAVPGGAKLGDQFQISLVNDPGFTYFDDLNGNPLYGGAYSMTGGVVTIAPSAVPEPSSLIITLTGMGLLGAWYSRRLRNSRSSAILTS